MKKKEQLYARMYNQSRNDYSHIYIDFYTIDEQGQKRFAFHTLEDFEIKCQITNGENKPYAIKFQGKHGTDHTNYIEHNKIFKKVDKGIDVLNERFGRWETFNQFVKYIFDIFKVKQFNYAERDYSISELNRILEKIIG